MTAAAKVSWRQALAWRLKRQFLDLPTDLGVEEVVRRLSGVQAQVASSAELAVRLRRGNSAAGEVSKALADGRLIKTWANRGTLHLLTPEEGGGILSLVAANRSWERPSWQRYFGITPQSIEDLRHAAREVLDRRALTREELIGAVTLQPGLKHLGKQLRSGWGTLLKPLAWQGDLVYGPSQGTRVTFTTPETASKRWAGVPSADEAGPRVFRAYLSAYGPATVDNFAAWLTRPTRKQLRGWIEAAGTDVAEVEVDGENAYILAADVDELARTKPSRAVHLLGGFDQWVLGPGTADTHIIPAGRRQAVSKTAGWIAPVVVVGGVVAGTWELKGEDIAMSWFPEASVPPRARLEAGIERLSSIVGRRLRVTI